MDYREIYKDHFYAQSKNGPNQVLAWPERNGFGLQSLNTVGTDKGTVFLYKEDFNKVWDRIPEGTPEHAAVLEKVAKIVEKQGITVTPGYKAPERSFWS